jgi:SAM-dependent methyltransferase
LPSCIFDEVIALDVIEHIPNVVGLMDEIHRVLVDNGKLSIRVPQAGTYNHITDPTHVRGFGIDSFDFFDDKTELGRGNGRLYTSRRWSIIDKGPQNLNLIFNMLALKPYTRRRSWL